MRSLRFLAVAVLAVLLVASSLSLASADTQTAIEIVKATKNGHTTTLFHFVLCRDASCTATMYYFDLRGGENGVETGLHPGDWLVRETVPSGWVLEAIVCGVSGANSRWEINLGSEWQLIIHLAEDEQVRCTFTNAPAAPVGGVVAEPVNTLAVLAPWIAVIGLVGCVATVVVVAKRRHI